VNFIDDIDPELTGSGSEPDIFPQISHLVDAAVGSGVDFQHVHRSSVQDFLAGGTFTAGIDGGTVFAVEGSG